MKKVSITIILLFGFLLSVVSTSFLIAADRSKIKDGVKAFEKEQWDESLNKFQDALVDDPTNSLLHFNVGDVHYKKKNYEEAIKSFEKALTTSDVTLQEKVYFNLGNSYYQNNKYKEAIDYYKKALDLNPDDLDAKYNLELVRAKIKEMSEKQPMDNQQNQPLEPSEYAKKLKEQAEAYISQRLYEEAYNLMMEGLKVDQTVAAFQSFIERLKNIVDIENS